MNKNFFLAFVAFLFLSSFLYFSFKDLKYFGKAQIVETAPAAHTTCKADLDYPNSNGYTESYTRPNKCHSKIVFYKFADYYATGNCGNGPWCNIRVRCPAGSTIQTHNSGGGWHYSMSPNIGGKYDGPAHYFCGDANGTQFDPLPGESEIFPNHTHSINVTKVSLQKVHVVDLNESYYYTFRPDKLGLSSNWVNCPAGAYGPYPQGSTAIDLEYGGFPNHFHCKNAQQNLTNNTDIDDDPEALPVAFASPPSFDLVGSGFGNTTDTTTLKDQFVNKDTNWSQTPFGTIRCVHSNSNKVYFSTTGTCPDASLFPIPQIFQYSLSANAGTVTAGSNQKALSKFKIVNAGAASAFEILCRTNPSTPVELKGFNPDTILQPSVGTDTVSYAISIAANSEKEFGASVDLSTANPGTISVSCNVYPQRNQSDNRTISDTITVISPTLTGTSPSDPFLIGYWKFDGNAKNEVVGSPDAVAVGNPIFNTSSGKIGGYVLLPSASDFLKIPYNIIFDLPDTFTIEFWFRQRASQSFAQNLISKGTPINKYNFYIFRQLNNISNKGPIITGYTAKDTGYWTQTSNSNDLAHGIWHHVVFVKSLTERAYYLDGILTHKSDSDSPTALTPAEPIIIGGDKTVDTDFDNLKIYKRALIETEIIQNSGFTNPTIQPVVTQPDDFTLKHAGCNMMVYRKNAIGQYIDENGQAAAALQSRPGYFSDFRLIDDHYHICETVLAGPGTSGSGSITGSSGSGSGTIIIPPQNDFEVKHAGCDMMVYRKNENGQYIDERGQAGPVLQSRLGYIKEFRFVDGHYHICETALPTSAGTSGSGSITVTPTVTSTITTPSAVSPTPTPLPKDFEAKNIKPAPVIADLPPIEKEFLLAPEISNATQCDKEFINNVKATLKNDKQLWKDLRRQIDQSEGYPSANEVEDLLDQSYQSLVTIDKNIKTKITAEICETIKDQLNVLHTDYLSQFTDYQEEISEFIELSQCRSQLTSFAEKLAVMLDNAKIETKKVEIQNLFDLVNRKLEELAAEHDFAYDPIYECNGFIEEIESQIAKITVENDEEIARIVDTVLVEKLQPVFKKLEEQLENSGKTLETVLAKVANLHKSLEALNVAAINISEKIATSYNALSLIEDKFVVQKEEIQTAKDRLITLVDQVTVAIKNFNCVQGQERDKILNVISDIVAINWLNEEAENVEQRLNSFLASCEAREIKVVEVTEFEKNTNDSATENQEQSFELGLTPYSDVPTHVWYYGGMLSMAKNGIMKQGRPAEPILRQDALLTVLRFSGFSAEVEPDRNCALPQGSLVTKASPYALCAIQVGLQNGLLLGDDMTLPIQRGEIANWMATMNMVPEINIQKSSEIQSDYSDLKTAVPKDWLAAIVRIVDVNVMVGQVSDTAKNWQPFENLNRASLSVILDRLLALKF